MFVWGYPFLDLYEYIRLGVCIYTWMCLCLYACVCAFMHLFVFVYMDNYISLPLSVFLSLSLSLSLGGGWSVLRAAGCFQTKQALNQQELTSRMTMLSLRTYTWVSMDDQYPLTNQIPPTTICNNSPLPPGQTSHSVNIYSSLATCRCHSSASTIM